MEDKNTEREHAELDRLQAAYKASTEEWVIKIREEEALASVDHTLAQVDEWEQAHFRQKDAQEKAEAAKAAYEDALREKFFGF